MSARLFGVAASHPTLAAKLMLRQKGVEYRRVDLPTVTHRSLLRAMGYPGKTVPAMQMDGAKVQGTTEIARALDALRPSPPLFPADSRLREQVEVANTWGDEALQPVARRVTLNAVARAGGAAVRSYLADAKLGVPVGLVAPMAPAIARPSRRVNGATDEAAMRDLEALPGLIDRVDELIAQGVVGGSGRNG